MSGPAAGTDCPPGLWLARPAINMHPTHITCPTRSSCHWASYTRPVALGAPGFVLLSGGIPLGRAASITTVAAALRLLLRDSNRVQKLPLLRGILLAQLAQTTEALFHADQVGAPLQIEIT